MMRTFKTAILGVAFVAAGMAHAASSFVELDNVADEGGFDKLYTAIYFNTTFKINDRYSITPETVQLLNYRTGGNKDFNLTHSYLRFSASDKSLAKVGSWNLGISYRWITPTSSSYQKAGSLGRLDFRPTLTNKWGGISLMIREGFQVHLQRNAYQVNVPKDKAAGNPLISNNLEINPEFDFGGGFSGSLYFSFTNAFLGGKPNGGATSWSNSFYRETEVGYSSPAINDFYLAFYISQNTDYGNGAGFKLFAKDQTGYHFKIDKAF